jgi:preprotein translocase subunit SecG
MKKKNIIAIVILILIIVVVLYQFSKAKNPMDIYSTGSLNINSINA